MQGTPRSSLARVREATAFWYVSPELIHSIDEHLGAPIDGYVNGSQVWLDDGIEYRLHPVAGFRTPDGISHHDLWDEVTAAGTTIAPASLWDAFEAIPVELGADPARVAEHAGAVVGMKPDRFGLVDREVINEEWDRTGGAVSIGARLLEQLSN